MSCTITVSGKDSATFNALAAEFGGRAALESILDSDGTSTIDGFLSDVEQSNRVNAVAYHVLDYLRSIDAVTSLDMSPEMLSEDNIKVALEAARNNFVSIIQDNLSENMSEEEKRVASRAYVAYRNFSELVPKVICKFENFGLTIAEVNNDMDHISDMEESETSDKQHIYSQSNLERNPLDSVSPSVKLFFSARPRKVFDASGEVVNAIDDLGMAVPVDFHDLYSKVMKNLTDISTYEEMEAKLEELAEVDPDIKGLVEDLQDAKFDKRGVTINGIKSTPLKNAFFTAMNNTQYDHLSVIIDVDRYAEEPGVKKVSLLEPNRRNLSKSLRNEWASNVTKLMKLPKSQKVELWEKRVQKVFDPSSSFSDISLKKERKKAFDKQLADPKSKVALVNVANMLELIGIRVSPEAVSVLRTNMNRQESGGFAKFVNSKLYNLGKNFYTGDTNIFESEITTLTLLSDAQANLKGELGNRSFLNGEGNLVFPINKPTFAKEWFSEMSNKGKLFEDLANDPFYGESKIVKDFIEEYDIQMRSFDTITDNTTNSVIPFSELDPVTSLATRYNLFMNYNSKGILSKIDSKYGWFMVPTPADRTGTQVFKMRLLGRGKFVDKFNVFSEESGYKDWAINSAKAEFKRIATVREEFQLFKDNTSELVENYHYIGNELGNGGYFQYFPELNNFLKEEDGVLQDIDFSSPEVLSALETAIQNQIAEDINYLQEIGFLENDSSPKPSKQAKKFIKAPHFDESSLYKFLLNSYVANQELSSLMYGDIAHFKGNRIELGSEDPIESGSETIISQTNLANANKRAGLAFTPGSKLRVGNGGVKATFEVAFVNDVINNLESDVYDSIAESIPKNQSEKFKRTNSTDGQGLAMLDRYAELLNGQGLLTPAMQTTLEELKKDNPDWNKVTEKLVPVKGFYHSNEFDGEFNRVMPKNLKYSLLPIFPSMMKNNPKLQEMYKKMLDSKVNELVFVSGSKMGAYNVNNAEDAIYKTVTLNNNRYRIPQVVPYKSKVLENFGSQMRKLIESNLVEDGDYNGKSGSQLRDDYNAAISLKIQNAFRDMIEGFISDGHIDIEKVAKRVLDEIENNKYRSDSDFINKALEIIETETGKDTRVPMSFPAIKYKVESVLNSMAKKAVNRLTLPGFVGVVYTSYGMNTGEIATDKTLKFVRKDKNGNVLPAQVKMSPQYFLGVLRDKTKKLTNDLARTKNDEVKAQIQEEIKDINSVISQLVSGTFDITKMPAHVRQGVIYRIPTQGKNSMLPIEVVEFTPEAFSTSITLPAAIVTQSGMDYDIDKVYVELKHTSYSNGEFYTATPTLNTREGIDNTIVQTHYDVLTSPAHFAELVTPNNTDTLEKLVNEISEIYEVNRVGSKWSSVSTQDGFRDKNQAGGVFIGIASNANTAHALYQSLGVTLSNSGEEVQGIAEENSQETEATGVTVNGKVVRSLSLVQNALGGLISDDHIEIQTAAVDNASNPLLGHLNINTVTGSTFLFLVESGAGLNYSVRLLNTPIIRELVRRTRINEATMGKEGAYQDALSSLAKDRKFNMEYVSKNDYDVSMSDIDNAINSARGGEMVSDHDFDILRAFITFKRYGDNLVTFQSAMRHDVKGTRQTIAANVLATNKLARITGTYSDENYKGHYIDSYVPVFFDKDKYNKHSIKTFEEYGLHKPIQLAGLFIADSSDTFRTLLDRVSDDLGNMNDTDARLLMTDFYTFLFANQAPHADLNTRSVISETVPETTLELMVGQNSVAKKLIAAKLKEHARAKEDLSYIPNMLLSSLSAELDNRQTGTDVVSFNNSISRALTSDQKSLLSNEFYELLVHEDPFYRSLALELFALNFFTEGFSRGINSYSEFIPIEIYEHFKGESGKSMVDYFRDLWQDFQDPKKFNISDFVFKFYANRGQELSGIRDLTNMSDAKIKSYLAKNPKVKVFLAKTKGKTAIGSRILKSNNYSIITETMGTKGWRVDYQGFGEVSRALSSMQALKVEEAKSNVEQKNC